VKPFRVEISPEALAQAETINAWWDANRTAAPSLFYDELTAAVEKLKALPRSGIS
jgi:hypothetical protein